MEKETGRVEAFSDGVFAIAITLLILDIHVPNLEDGISSRQLLAALTHLWPSLVAFLLSFFVILVMWVNHHEFMLWLRRCDYRFFFANGLVLLMVTFIPFPTALMARYLGTGAARGAVAAYCGTFFCASIAYQVLLRSVISKRRLVRDEVPDELLESVRRAYNFGPLFYGLATVLALWNAIAGLVLCSSLWILWTRLAYRPFREN
jgi:uncharacterized membrane protein